MFIIFIAPFMTFIIREKTNTWTETPTNINIDEFNPIKPGIVFVHRGGGGSLFLSVFFFTSADFHDFVGMLGLTLSIQRGHETFIGHR